MKVSIIFSQGVKQINFTPENQDEKQALKLITPNDNIKLAVKAGSFGEERYKPFSIDINNCQGEYLRAFEGTESIMLVLSPRDLDVQKEEVFTRRKVEELQNDVHDITGDGRVMELFNAMLGVNAGGGS